MNQHLVIDRGFTTNVTYNLIIGNEPWHRTAHSGDSIVCLDDTGPPKMRGSLLNETRGNLFLNGELTASA